MHIKRTLLNILKHPLTRDLDIDYPQTTLFRKQIIQQKPFLCKIYIDWYTWIASNIPHGPGRILELGSGAGFLDKFLPGLITTEVFFNPFVRMVMDGCSMPFADRSLKAIVMVDVFHHIPDSEVFLKEVTRCLRPGGKVLMVEPWATAWSSFIYTHLHHEPFDSMAKNWSFPTTGPLSGANSALPSIVFERDRSLFLSKFPRLKIEGITIEKPFVYLLSGGVSLRSFMPGFSYIIWARIENLLSPWIHKTGMFAKIQLSRV